MDCREDFDVLAELGETLAQLEQCSGPPVSGQNVNSSSVNRRIAEYARKCKGGELKGRSRRRQSNALLLEMLRALDRWK
jgi:hypothetical protein